MKKMEIPLGKKQDIVADYKNKDLKVSEICEKYEISHKQLVRILQEMGETLRQPQKGKRTNTKHRCCPTCHRPIIDKDYKFCPYCATDIRDEKELLIEKLGELWSRIYPVIGANDRDYVRSTINEITNYLKKESK